MSRTADPDLWEWWCDLIEFHEGNSLPVAEICRMHDVSTASFYNWRKRIRDAHGQRPEVRSRTEESQVGEFLPVRVSVDGARRESTGSEGVSPAVHISLAGGTTIVIPAADRDLVLAVIATLCQPEVS
jgi:transposase